MSDEKFENLPFAGTPVSRSTSYRDRKKEKFRRHIASLSSPSNNNNNPVAAGTKKKKINNTVLKARTPPAAFRTLHITNDDDDDDEDKEKHLIATPSEDSESYGGRFPKRQIKYVTTSPSEDSEVSASTMFKRPIRSLMTNPSEDSIDTTNTRTTTTTTLTNTSQKEPSTKLPVIPSKNSSTSEKSPSKEIGNEKVTLTPKSSPSRRLGRSPNRTFKSNNSSSSSSPLRLKNSVPQSNVSSSIPFDELERKSNTSVLSDEMERRSNVSIPFDELERQSDVSIPFDELSKNTTATNKKNASGHPDFNQETNKGSFGSTFLTRTTTKRSQSPRIPKVQSLKSFRSEDTTNNNDKGTKTTTSNRHSRSRSLTRNVSSDTPNKQSQTGVFSRRVRSMSQGRKSILVERIAKKQSALFQSASQKSQKVTKTPGSLQNDQKIGAEKAESNGKAADTAESTKLRKENTNLSVNKDEKIHNLVENNQKEVELLHENLARHDGQMEYDDPPLEELESEVSVGYDMGSIHDYLPSDNQKQKLSQTDQSEPWPTSNVVFETVGDEKKDEASDGREVDAGGTNTDINASLHDASRTAIEEKKEKDSSENVDSLLDLSWDTSRARFTHTAAVPKNTNFGSDGVDMFDTTSWAADTDARFSDVSLSRLAENADLESQFVKLMMEEMKVRALSEEERRTLFEAQKNVQRAEEMIEADRMTIQKDDVPLIGQSASSDGDQSHKNNIALEERLMMYSAGRHPDEDSVDDDGESQDSRENFSDNDDDARIEVNYVEQEDFDEKEACSGSPRDARSESSDLINHLKMVPASDVPTFHVGSLERSSENKHDSALIGPSLQVALPPPPPPPGSPKRKTKKNRPRSGLNKDVPLIPLPSEEKLQKWQQNKARAEDYVAAMKEKLMNSDMKALDVTKEFFYFPEDNDNICAEDNNSEENLECTTSAHQDYDDESTSQDRNQQTPFSMETGGGTEENETVDPMERCSDEEINNVESHDPRSESLNKIIHDIEDEGATIQVHSEGSENQTQQYSEIILDEVDEEGLAPHLDQSLGEGESAYIMTDNEIGSRSRSQDEPHPSLFGTPGASSVGAKFSRIFNNKPGQAKNYGSILVNERMADKVAMASSAAASTFEEKFPIEKMGAAVSMADRTIDNSVLNSSDSELLQWFSSTVLLTEFANNDSFTNRSEAARSILEDPISFNAMCDFVADNVNKVSAALSPGIEKSESLLSSFDDSTVISGEHTIDSIEDKPDVILESKRPQLRPVAISEGSMKLSPKVLAANYVSFFYMASKLAKVQSPFGDNNPFLTMIVESSLSKKSNTDEVTTPQELLFSHLDGKADMLIEFVRLVKQSCDDELRRVGATIHEDDASTENDAKIDNPFSSPFGKEIHNLEGKPENRRYIVPPERPSPFEVSTCEVPRIIAVFLSFLGDPVAVCRMKMVNRFCYRVVLENEHTLMQNAVRTGGIEMSVRPAFWMWVTLDKCDLRNHESKFNGRDELRELSKQGEGGKWHQVIKRDVERAFGIMPPHKHRAGGKARSDSIVRALVTWGQNRIMKRGVKGGGEPLPVPDIGPKQNRKLKKRPNSPSRSSSPPWNNNEEQADEGSLRSEGSETPTDTVSDWSGVSPKGSFAGSVNDPDYEAPQDKDASLSASEGFEELALSGNTLTNDAKVDLRIKLSFILHTLAIIHSDIGYCQGMDYVVAHLLRILQETIRWKTTNGSMPSIISTAKSINLPEAVLPVNYESIYQVVDKNLVVEETIVRVMDTFFMNYNLRHMYWPELRCLKTCCRVFERLIQTKLPVLADHFDHHDLNVGLFALGWFQTLFLYLPSMPSVTVCHMWDIWLVERSFKIFFRVGTAILFLSQPTLLNHELEGMMTYLNTIPDATLLQPDILIPCALNIKVTNRMLQELEAEVMRQP